MNRRRAERERNVLRFLPLLIFGLGPSAFGLSVSAQLQRQFAPEDVVAFKRVVSLAVSSDHGAQQAVVSGSVVDITGAAVPGARISSGVSVAITDARGRFQLTAPDLPPVLEVSAEGFATRSVVVSDPFAETRIVLQPAALAETVTVTAARSATRLSEGAVAATTITGAALRTSPSAALDDVLRGVPGFSLFRRSSSRVANPTTQGAGVRGLAASGASRMLVLADGVPINDPFGSWVHWGSVPLAAIDRVEVLRGGVAGELYGSEAVAGVVQIITSEPAAVAVRALGEGGGRGHARGSVYAGARGGRWSGFGAAERLVFDGYTLVAPDERGPVDTPAGVKSWSGLGSLGWQTERLTVSGRAGWFDEDRANGTALQTNDTNARRASLRATALFPAGVLTATAYAGEVDYDQAFSAVRAGRQAEILTATQRVDSTQTGADATWSQAWARGRALAGLELRRVRGTSRQTSYSQGVPSAAEPAGGAQSHEAVFGQVAIDLADALTATAGARGALWRTETLDSSDDGTRGSFSPRASLAWRAEPQLALHLTATWTDRTPTLNELHRDFRVGNILTSANDRLEPERARTVEGGALWQGAGLSARVLGFWTRLDGAVTNVTISDPGDELILRQRRNAGAIRARGIESEVEWRPRRDWSVTGSLAVLDSIFTESAEPGLTGRRVPQVPRWQAGAAATYATGAAAATIEWRSTGAQFDDDRNRFVLGSGQVLNAYVSARAGGVHPFVAVENVFDAEIDVGRTPVRTLGLPRTWRAGVRITRP